MGLQKGLGLKMAERIAMVPPNPVRLMSAFDHGGFCALRACGSYVNLSLLLRFNLLVTSQNARQCLIRKKEGERKTP
jgi:hypothetical protein